MLRIATELHVLELIEEWTADIRDERADPTGIAYLATGRSVHGARRPQKARWARVSSPRRSPRRCASTSTTSRRRHNNGVPYCIVAPVESSLVALTRQGHGRPSYMHPAVCTQYSWWCHNTPASASNYLVAPVGGRLSLLSTARSTAGASLCVHVCAGLHQIIL